MTCAKQSSCAMGAKKADFANVSGDLELVRPLPQPVTLTAKLQRNPQLARWTYAGSAPRARVQMRSKKNEIKIRETIESVMCRC